MKATAIDRPPNDFKNSKQKKSKHKRRNSHWPDNPVVLTALCFLAAMLIAAARLGFDGVELFDSKKDPSLQAVAKSSPSTAPNASSTAIVPLTGHVSNDDAIQPPSISIASKASNPSRTIGHEVENAVPDHETSTNFGTGDRAVNTQRQMIATRANSTTGDASKEAGTEGEDAADRRIAGRVMTANGQPVADMRVTALLRRFFGPTGHEPTPYQRTQQAVTDANGRYSFNELAEGEYLIRTAASDRYAQAHAVVRRGVGFADLVLAAQRTLDVQGVVTGSGREQIAGVHVLPLVGGIPRDTRTDAEGRFQLTVAYDAGKRGFPILFRAKGYRELRLDVREADKVESGSVELDVTLQPVYETIAVSGNVTGRGLPVAGESVQLYSQSLQRSYQAITDEVGEFLFPAVEAADDYRLWVHPVGPYRDYQLPNLDVTVQEPRVQIVLEPLEIGPRLEGRMVDVYGNPVPGVTLIVRSTRATHQALQVTGDRQGRYTIDNAPAGELVFENRSMPYYTISGVRVSAQKNNKQRNVPLVLDWGQHELRGRIVDGGNAPVPAPRIYLTWSHFQEGVRSRSSRTTAADAKGRFLFTGLGPGPHTLTVNAPGFEGVRLRHEVGAQDRDIVVQLEKRSSNFRKASF